MAPLPVASRVFPFKSATVCTVSPPSSPTYRTPSTFTASTVTPPWVFWYNVAARLAGTAAMSTSPCKIRGISSSAAPTMVGVYSGSSSSCAMPMAVGPVSAPTRTAVVSQKPGTVSIATNANNTRAEIALFIQNPPFSGSAGLTSWVDYTILEAENPLPWQHGRHT